MENIYVQVRGRKHFTLIPPLCHPCTNEQLVPPATYRREADGELVLDLDQGAEPVPLATWDPDEPGVNATRFSHLAQPLKVTLEPGDVLYLPAMWYVAHTKLISCNWLMLVCLGTTRSLRAASQVARVSSLQ